MDRGGMIVVTQHFFFSDGKQLPDFFKALAVVVHSFGGTIIGGTTNEGVDITPLLTDPITQAEVHIEIAERLRRELGEPD